MRMLVSFFYLAVSVWLSSCSTILKEPPESPQMISSVLPPQEEVKPVRSIGSLWTSNSSWNSLYSATTSRAEGDFLEVQLTNAVKSRIDGLRKKLLKEKYGDENYEATKKDSGVLATDAPSEPAKKVAMEPLPSSMQALIKDVGQRGLYKISAFETVKVGDEETRLYIEGLVRDKDIDAEDKVSADSIYGIKIELRPKGPGATPPVDQKVVSSAGGSNVSW